MDEGAVTVDGVRHPLPDPFFVVATQNPLEQHGTYPLPEGQLDRFAVCLRLGGLDLASERLVVREQLVRPTVDDLTAVVDPGQLLAAGRRADHVRRGRGARTRAGRRPRDPGGPADPLGASSRAALTLVRCAQARALLTGRDYVVPDDTKALAPAVLAHRLVLSDGMSGTGSAGARAEALVADLVTRVPVPVQ
jgi:MoxR-like ATPase